MSEQPLERASVRALVKWAKVVLRQGDGEPSRPMRRAQGRLLETLCRESAAPPQAANDASMVVLLGDSGTSDAEQTRRLMRPKVAAETIDRIVELLTPPADTDVSLEDACSAFRTYLEAGAGSDWPSYRAVMRLQLSVWHHTGIDPSPVVKTLVDAVEEDGVPEHPDAVVKAAVDAYVQGAHDRLAAEAIAKHGGPEGIRESMGLSDDAELHLRTSFPGAGVPHPDPDRAPPRAGDVVEPTVRLLASVPGLADDAGDVLEHMEAAEAPAGVPCSKVNWRKAEMAVIVEDNLLDTVMRCTCHQLSDPDPVTAECLACGSRDCPTGHELHYHHDGCPDCIREEEA